MDACFDRPDDPDPYRTDASARYGSIVSVAEIRGVRDHSACPREAGFSLLETLLALLLMTAIMTVLGIVTSQWLPFWDRGFQRMQGVAAVAVGVDRLVRDLAAAEFVTSGGADDPPVFDGAEQEVTFVRTAIGPNTPPGLQIIHIGVAIEDRRPALTRTITAFAIGKGGPASARPPFSAPVTLVRAPFQVRFSYAGEDREWRSDWRGQQRLPRAIQVLVTDFSGARVMIAAAMVGAQAPARCVGVRTMAQCETVISGSAAQGAPGSDQ
jgi:general secretion pathway protein J